MTKLNWKRDSLYPSDFAAEFVCGNAEESTRYRVTVEPLSNGTYAGSLGCQHLGTAPTLYRAMAMVERWLVGAGYIQ